MSVFVVKEGWARIRSVEIGRFFAQVVSGRELGEKVMLYPNDRVLDGVRIEQR